MRLQSACGLAGGLRADLPTGTVVIPHAVRRPDGTLLRCDAELSEILIEAAHPAGLRSGGRAVLTSETLVHGSERAICGQIYAAVDMETGLIRAARIACVRVILDTPKREISPAWLSPASVIAIP